MRAGVWDILLFVCYGLTLDHFSMRLIFHAAGVSRPHFQNFTTISIFFEKSGIWWLFFCNRHEKAFKYKCKHAWYRFRNLWIREFWETKRFYKHNPEFHEYITIYADIPGYKTNGGTIPLNTLPTSLTVIILITIPNLVFVLSRYTIIF